MFRELSVTEITSGTSLVKEERPSCTEWETGQYDLIISLMSIPAILQTLKLLIPLRRKTLKTGGKHPKNPAWKLTLKTVVGFPVASKECRPDTIDWNPFVHSLVLQRV